MTISAATHPNYVELMKMMAPDGSIMPVAEILNETNDGILDYINFMEGNLEDGHTYTQRTGLPTISRGRINKGVVPSKGLGVQVTDRTTLLESMSEVHARLVERASDPGMFRLQQDRPHIESLNQQFVQDIFYGDPEDEIDQYRGLAVRYSDATPATGAGNRDNIIDASAGTDYSAKTDLRSIWLICWGPMTCTGIIPKRTTANLKSTDLGKRWVDDDGSNTGARIEVYGTHFEWYSGLAVPDWRYVVRIANISEADLKYDAASGPNLVMLMKEAIERLPSLSAGRCAFYAPRVLMKYIRGQLSNGVANSTLVMEDVGMTSVRKRIMIDEVPVFRCDQLIKRDAAGAASADSFVPFLDSY